MKHDALCEAKTPMWVRDSAWACKCGYRAYSKDPFILDGKPQFPSPDVAPQYYTLADDPFMIYSSGGEL